MSFPKLPPGVPVGGPIGFDDDFDYRAALGEIKRQIRSGVDLESGMVALVDYAESRRPSIDWGRIRSLDFRADAEALRARIASDTADGSLSPEIHGLYFSAGIHWPDEVGNNIDPENVPEPHSCLGLTGTAEPFTKEAESFHKGYRSGGVEVRAIQEARVIAGVRDLLSGGSGIEAAAKGREAHDFIELGFLGLILSEWCRSPEGRRLLLGGAAEREIHWDNTYARFTLGRITSDSFQPQAETADPRFWSGFGPDERSCAERLIQLALAEDLGIDPGLVNSTFLMYCVSMPWETGYLGNYFPGDMTGLAVIPEEAEGTALVVARSAGVLAGGPTLSLLADLLRVKYEPKIADGTTVRAGDVIARIGGEMRSLLAMERTALNFLQRLSGVASMTARFVSQVAGTKAAILDTRKTTPGWRALEKYAVRCGGGTNHRIGLYDAILIKDNHLAWLATGDDPIGRAVAESRNCVATWAPAQHKWPPERTKFVEVEVDTLEQFDRALEVGPDIILVDNLGPEKLAEAVRRRDERAPGILLEASGGVTLATVRALAETGVDRISVGALTHSAPALDIGLDFDRAIVP